MALQNLSYAVSRHNAECLAHRDLQQQNQRLTVGSCGMMYKVDMSSGHVPDVAPDVLGPRSVAIVLHALVSVDVVYAP